MITYCDRLSLQSCLSLVRRRARTVRVLDPLSSAQARLLRRALAWTGCTVEQAEFFAGHLRMPDGESVYAAARRTASGVSLEAGRAVVALSLLLRGVEEQIGADRVAIPLARRWNAGVEHTVMQVLIARALRGKDQSAELLIARPALAMDRQIAEVAQNLRVRLYGGRFGLLQRLAVVAEVLRENVRRLTSREKPAALAVVSTFADGRPGVLMIKEEDVGQDPSYRRQPHWLPIGERQKFASFIVDNDGVTGVAANQDAMVLSLAATYAVARTVARSEARTHLARAARRCTWRALFSPALTVSLAHGAAARLLSRADVFAGLCDALGIRSFVCCDPYKHDADAVQAGAGGAGVTTVVFQYSHLAMGNVVMATTADLMLGFSDWYAATWDYKGVRPGRFVAAGYPFDHAFALVRDRAARHRQKLADAGARFVIAYFDENVGPPVYGFIAVEELQAELETLAALVLADPTIGIVFKSQFMKNTPSARMGGNQTFQAALATGRMIDLFAGQHRNCVLPCEAALTADMVIGHPIGGTAVVEAALAGRRGILVSDGRTRTGHDELYRNTGITCPSFGDALNAIAAFRRRDPAFATLGDWSSKLAVVDPFRDGGASRRLLDVVSGATLRGLDYAAAKLQSAAPHLRVTVSEPA
jgi:hypothetical protein